MPDINAALAKLHQSGLLPLLLQKMGIHGMPQLGAQQSAATTGPKPGTSPVMTGAQVPGVGSGASPSGGGGAPPTGGSLPIPKAQPHDAVNSVAELLMNWKQRKSKGEEAEAENIARRLMSAIDASKSPDERTRTEAIATVHEILNDKNSTKILDKVYKGWLQKTKEAQKPGAEPDSTVQGFESGLQKHVEEKNQSQMPSTMGGYRLPGAGPDELLKNITSQTEAKAAMEDPKRTLQTHLTSDEQRQAELAKTGLAETPESKAKLEESKSKIVEAASKVQIAQANAQKAQAELQIKEVEARTAKEKGAISLELERTKSLEAATRLDIARENLKRAIILKDAANQPKIKQSDKLKLEAATRAKDIVDGIVSAKRDLNEGDVQALQNELKTAGAQKLADGIRAAGVMGWFVGKKGTSSSATMLQNSLKIYIDTLEKNQSGAVVKPKAEETSAAGDEDDEVDADIVVNPEDIEPEKKP